MKENTKKWAFRAMSILSPVVIAVLLAIAAGIDPETGEVAINWGFVLLGLITSTVQAITHLVRVFEPAAPVGPGEGGQINGSLLIALAAIVIIICGIVWLWMNIDVNEEANAILRIGG